MPTQEKYKLQRLLEMRERARDQSALHLAGCREQLRLAEAELEERKSAVDNCRKEQTETQAEMIKKSGGGIRSTEIVRYRQHLKDLREKEIRLQNLAAEQETVVRRAEQTVEKALLALAEASKETKVIEKHRENWQTAKKTEADRREQKTGDEIGAILHEQRKFE